MWKFNGTREISVPITRYQPSARQNTECGSLELYGDYSIRNAQLISIPNPRWDTPCFISGSVKITAGVMRNVTGGYSVDLKSDTPLGILDMKRSANLEPDRWVNETLSLLPYVHKISLNNALLQSWDEKTLQSITEVGLDWHIRQYGQSSQSRRMIHKYGGHRRLCGLKSTKQEFTPG
jgi:hypothetical protein